MTAVSNHTPSYSSDGLWCCKHSHLWASFMVQSGATDSLVTPSGKGKYNVPTFILTSNQYTELADFFSSFIKKNKTKTLQYTLAKLQVCCCMWPSMVTSFVIKGVQILNFPQRSAECQVTTII